MQYCSTSKTYITTNKANEQSESVLGCRRKSRKTVVRSPASNASEDLKHQKLIGGSDLESRVRVLIAASLKTHPAA